MSEKKKITKLEYDDIVKKHWQECDDQIAKGQYIISRFENGEKVVGTGIYSGIPCDEQEIKSIKDMYQKQLDRATNNIIII